MKKINIALGIFALCSAFILTGCLPKKQPGIEQKPEEKSEEEGGGLFESIKDAMSKSLSLKCDYPTGDGGKITYYVKGNKVRFEGAWKTKDETVTVITEDKMFNWNLKTKEGLILPLKQQEGENKNVAEELINDLETNKKFCKTAVVSDSVFNPPADIKFNDLSKLMEKAQQPGTVKIPTINQEPTEAEPTVAEEPTQEPTE
jgi:hypothetical protein